MKTGIIGYGELGQQLRLFLEAIEVDDFVIFDDKSNHPNAYAFNKYLSFEDIQAYYIGLGYKHLELKSRILEILQRKGKQIPNLIHSTVYCASTSKIGNAVYIYPKCNIDKEVILHDGVLLNNSVTVSHNCEIGEATYLSPGVVLSGQVAIGKSCFLGSGVTVANGITIGNNVKIGIGSVITKDLPSNSCWIGNPCRIVDDLKLI